MTLTLADANRVIAGAIEKANQIGAKMISPCATPWPRPPSDVRVAI